MKYCYRPAMSDSEDKQLARLYDYTKFHIGIYLSTAAGIAALLGAEHAGWFLSEFVEPNRRELYAALAFMIMAGGCGGVVASSTIECKTFNQFWNADHGPAGPGWLKMEGRKWAAYEHRCFWLSLLLLAVTVAYGFGQVKLKPTSDSPIVFVHVCTEMDQAKPCQRE